MGPAGLKTHARARVANGQECDDNLMAEGIPVVPSRCFPPIVTYPGGNARESELRRQGSARRISAARQRLKTRDMVVRVAG
jgi:hypothetical protein